MKTAVNYLAEDILTEADKYNEDGDVIGIELWNAYRSCYDLSEFVLIANSIFRNQIEIAYQDGYNNAAYFNNPMTAQQYFDKIYINQ